MARTVLPLAGAFVGAFFGAPQLGYAIGSVIGNAVDPQRIKGPRIGDANVQTSQEGTPRPIVYGTAAVMGNLIDRGPLNKVITEERQGKGGGPVVENESLFMTFAIRICEGPIPGLLRIWEDERLVYDGRPESEIVEDSARYAQGFTLYLGDEDQLPDPDLEAIHGVGNTPAHRGSAYIVFKEKNLTERRGSIPQFRFEIGGTAEFPFGPTYQTSGPITPPISLIGGVSLGNQAPGFYDGDGNPSFVVPDGCFSVVVQLASSVGRGLSSYQIYLDDAAVTPIYDVPDFEVLVVVVPATPGQIIGVLGSNSIGAFAITFQFWKGFGTFEQIGELIAGSSGFVPGSNDFSELAAIVSDISDRCDLPQSSFDTSQLSGTIVRGLVLSGLYNGGDAVDALRKVYFFDPVEQDGKVVFVKRGAESVATITEDDLVDAPESAKRGQALEFPRKLHLDYQNADIGYAPAKATAARSSSDVRVVGEVSIEAPVVLSSDEAAQAADKLLKTTWTEADGEIQFAVGEEFLRLTPTDIITLSLRGTSKRLRITKIERQSGVLSITAVTDRVSSYTSSATGPSLRPPTTPPQAFAGPATLAVMDIPALVDTNDQLGIYIATRGDSTAWAGARVQVSTDGGANFTDLTDIRRACRVGTLLDDVTSALVGPVDSTNVLRVDFGRFATEIPSFTEQQWLSERGAIAILRGDGSAEIMQYRDAVPLGSSSSSDAGVWEISPLIRGRLNSGATSHSAGATVVYLEDAAFVELTATMLGRELTFRAISFGETPEGSSFEQTFTFTGRSQIELPVLDLQVEENSLGVITANWTRRDRFGSDVAPILSANWQGYRVTFTGDTVATFDTTTPNYTFDASGLGTSAVTVSVAQLNRITGAGPSVSEVI